jgi:hypothetical protein
MRHDLPRDLYAAAYARHLISRAQVDPSRLSGILAYCAAGSIAHEAAALVAEVAPAPPHLILFDSGPCRPAAVESELRATLERYGGRRLAAVLDDPDNQALLRGGALRDRPDRLVGTLEAALTRFAVDTYLADAGDGQDTDDVVAPVVGHFLDWLSYLVAAHNSDFPAWAGDVLHVVSRDHPYRADWPGARSTRAVITTCAADALLRSDDARAAVLAQLSDDSITTR